MVWSLKRHNVSVKFVERSTSFLLVEDNERRGVEMICVRDAEAPFQGRIYGESSHSRGLERLRWSNGENSRRKWQQSSGNNTFTTLFSWKSAGTGGSGRNWGMEVRFRADWRGQPWPLRDRSTCRNLPLVYILQLTGSGSVSRALERFSRIWDAQSVHYFNKYRIDLCNFILHVHLYIKVCILRSITDCT